MTNYIFPNYIKNPYTGDFVIIGTESVSGNGFFGGNFLVGGTNSNLTISDAQTNFEISGDTVLGFPLTWFGYSNKSFHNPFTAEIAGLGISDRFSDIILTSGFLGYYHQSFTSQDKAPLNFEAYIGSTTPTDPVFSVLAHKWNGTTGKANLASTEKLAQFKNGFSSFNIWGDAGIDVGNAKLSFIAAGTYPTDSDSWVGVTNNGHNLTFNQSTGFTTTFQNGGSSIGTWTSSTLTALTNFVITQPVATSSTSTAITVTGGAHTTLLAGSESISANFNFGQTIQHATGALNQQRVLLLQTPTYSFVGASTLTTLIGFQIDKAPSAGTNATVVNTFAAQFGGNASIGPSQASQIYSTFNAPNHTITITGSTNNTLTTSPFSQVSLGILTITDSSAVTVTNAATLYIAGPPAVGGSVTLTNPYSLWVDSGTVRFDGIVQLALSGTGTLASGTLTITTTITASSVIIVTMKDANPGAGNLTVGLEVPSASRNVGAGTFVVRANIAAGTINVLDTSTFDWVVFG